MSAINERSTLVGKMNARARALEQMRDIMVRLSEDAAHAKDLYDRVHDGACYYCEGTSKVDTSRATGQPSRMEPCPMCAGSGLWP